MTCCWTLREEGLGLEFRVDDVLLDFNGFGCQQSNYVSLVCRISKHTEKPRQ